MAQNITVEPEAVTDEPVKTSSRKREFAAAAAATTVTVVLGLVATTLIERVGKTVKDRINPSKTEEEENESE